MKGLKRFAALLIAAMMVIGTVVPAMATSPDSEAPATSAAVVLTYNANGGTLNMSSQTAKDGVTVDTEHGTLTATPAEAGDLVYFDLTAKATHPDGLYFAGWGTSEKADVSFPSIATAESMSVYAIWANSPAKDYTIKFAASPSTDDTVDVPSDWVISIPAGKNTTTANPSNYVAKRNGFNFVGWKYDSAADKDYAIGETVPTLDPGLSGTMNINVDPTNATASDPWITNDNKLERTLYPVWQVAGPTDGTITYYANGGKFGTGENATTSVTDDIKIPAGTDTLTNYEVGKDITAPAKDGFTFLGWATTANANAAAYAADGTDKKDVKDKDAFYAVYEAPFKVVYNKVDNDATDAPAAITDKKIAAGSNKVDVDISVTGPFLEGYTFSGWSTTQVSAAGEPASTIPVKVTTEGEGDSQAEVKKATLTVTDEMLAKAPKDTDGIPIINLYAIQTIDPTTPTGTTTVDGKEVDTYKISVNKDDNHTYNVYQILTGTLGDDPDRLGDPQWGADSIFAVGKEAWETAHPKTGDSYEEFDPKSATVTIDKIVNGDYGFVSAQDFAEWLGNKNLEYDVPEISQILTKVTNMYNEDGTVKNPAASDKAGDKTVTAANAYETVPGYYMMVDVTNVNEEGHLPNPDTQQPNIIQVVSNVTVKIKKEVPEVDKKIVKDELGGDDYNDFRPDGEKTDNVSIGDKVTFQIKAKVPEGVLDYDYYFYIITDTLSEGFDLVGNDGKVYTGQGTQLASIVAYLEGANSSTVIQPMDTTYGGYNVQVSYEYPENENTEAEDDFTTQEKKTIIKFALRDAKKLAGQTVVFTYDAILNKYAEVDEDPNNNTANVTYSNSPSHKYNGDKKPSTTTEDNEGFPADETSNYLTEGPDSKTETYSTKIQITKVDEDGVTILTGAEFQLTGDSMEEVWTTETVYLKASEVEKYCQDNGIEYKAADYAFNYYKITSTGLFTTTAPATSNRMREATTNDDPDKGYVIDMTATPGVDDAIQVGDTIYRPYVPATDSTLTRYILVRANTADYEQADNDTPATDKDENGYIKYAKVTAKYRTQVAETENNQVLVKQFVDSDGIALFEGLGAGTYTLTETTTPDGYNTMDPITFTIAFSKDGTPKWSVGTSDDDTDDHGVTYNAENKQFEAKVVNMKGSKLPETGGIGTTIFYAGGAILVLLAGVLLVSKRRIA